MVCCCCCCFDDGSLSSAPATVFACDDRLRLRSVEELDVSLGTFDDRFIWLSVSCSLHYMTCSIISHNILSVEVVQLLVYISAIRRRGRTSSRGVITHVELSCFFLLQNNNDKNVRPARDCRYLT